MSMTRPDRVLPLIAVVALVTGACSKKAEPEVPVPTGQTTQAPRNNGTEGPASSTADAEAALRNTIANRRAAIENRIHFGYDRAQLTPEAETVLRGKVDALRTERTVRIRIEGHADERGSVEYNLALGLRRAHAARDFMVGFGLDASRFDVASLGEDRPLDRATTEAAYARNRRDEFVIVGGSVMGR